jgi:hypothetical protein
MIFSLDIQRARKGDCLILHYGSKDDPGLAIIDGGPANVYEPHLKPRLAQIREARNLDSGESLEVDLLMVSHIDDDHINGILELTKELVDAMDSQQPLPLKVRSFWHNTFDDIVKNDPDELLAAVTASFGAASLGDEPDTEGLDPSTAMVLASVSQGFRLRDDAQKLNLRLHPEVEGRLIQASKSSKGINLGKGLRFTVAGPMRAEVRALQKDHATFLNNLKNKKDDTETRTVPASFTDESVANLSSIVVLAVVGKKRILLTGDARGDKILQGLELVGILKNNDKIHVDILKAPHHGSDRNIEPIFFQRITADHYVFSGNGEHGNPERETLQMLLDTRGNETFTIHLTYPVEEIDIEREKNWIKEQQKEKNRKKNKPGVTVRDDWSPEKHSLQALFTDHPDFATKVKIVEEDKPHVIDLLDKVGF